MAAVTAKVEPVCNANPLIVAAVASGYPVRASTEYDPNHSVTNCVINSQKSRASAHSGCESTNDSTQWIGVCFCGVKKVIRIATQGRCESQQFITQYKVTYSIDGISWAAADNDRVFQGNSDQSSVAVNDIITPFYARSVRINPVAWSNHISTKFEVYFEDD